MRTHLGPFGNRLPLAMHAPRGISDPATCPRFSHINRGTRDAARPSDPTGHKPHSREWRNQAYAQRSERCDFGHGSSSLPSCTLPLWWNWHTRRLQNPLPTRVWGFNSLQGHQETRTLSDKIFFGGAAAVGFGSLLICILQQMPAYPALMSSLIATCLYVFIALIIESA